MIAHERKQSGLTVFLFFYAQKACACRSFSFYSGERRRIRLSPETLQTASPVEVILEKEESFWKLNGKQLRDGGFETVRISVAEQVMVTLAVRKERLMPCERLLLSGRHEIRIGSAFRNEVFYECFSLVKDKHIRIHKEEKGYVLEAEGTKEEGAAFLVYVNGAALEGKHLLAAGDRIELLGLVLVYLQDLLICTAFYGTLRTVRRKELLPAIAGNVSESIAGGGVQIQQKVIEDREILEGEVELNLPEPMKIQIGQPLFLTLGPSVTMVIPMLLMTILGSALLGENGASYYRISAVMTVSSAFLAVFWGLANHGYQKKAGRKEERNRRETYLEYLAETEQYLYACMEQNQMILREKYPDAESFFPMNGQAGQIFWNRSTGQKDYLFVRLGTGEIPFQMQIRLSNRKEVKRDLLAEEAYSLLDKYRLLKEVPVGIDLKRQRITGFAGDGIYPVFLQAVLQLAACHNGKDLKLLYFYHEEEIREKEIADCIRWLPHVWSSRRKCRYLAGNEKEAGELLPRLTGAMKEEQKEKGVSCSYLFLLAAPEFLKGEGLYSFLTDTSKNSGAYVFFVNKEREQLPPECENLVICENGREEVIYYEEDVFKKQRLAFEKSYPSMTEKFMRQMSVFSFAESGEEEMPEKLSFLRLYSCERAEELNCPGRWMENQTGERIRVPIGMGAGGRKVCLDVHEKFHGPHGLVAGTTGSGKSELLQTYLLSLAVSFGPEDINFFIIDYKGGGMGNTLCKLPHCAGVISNLSGRQIKRALASIKSENRRRQRLFNLAGVNHVSDYANLYQEGKVKEPIPHLLLVVDEFAELKKEEPEFMQEIISVAQVGRSLGIHLILSTQKPAGTVDDKIWSNTRFRLCLRVADRQDSMDMLHRPEAAYLTGAGRGYLQVGNNELYELFQAGYGGAEHAAAKDAGQKKQGVCCMVSDTGRRFYKRMEKKEKYCTQMDAVIAYIKGVAESLGYKMAQNLWIPELPEKISLADAEGEERVEDAEKNGNVVGRAEGNAAENVKGNRTEAAGENVAEGAGGNRSEAVGEDAEIKLCIGLCDDPERQLQYPVYYRPLQKGHLALCGAPAVGKSTFLQTLLWQLAKYPVEQVQFMLAASDHAGVNCYEKMPGCLGAMKKAEEAECFFFHVERLFTERKERLSGINFRQYRKHREDAGAFLFLVIDNYGSFRQATEDRYGPLIEKLAGEGLNYGIYLMITALNIGAGELPGKLFEKMKVTLSLEMSDKLQYGDVLHQYHLNVWPRENVKGRGLCREEDRILEFQVPLISTKGDDYSRIHQILTLSEELSKRILENQKKEIPEKFPTIPDKVFYSALLSKFKNMRGSKGSKASKGNRESDEIPFCYEERSGYIVSLSLKKDFPFLISGEKGTGKTKLLFCMMKGLLENGVNVVLLDYGGKLSDRVRETFCCEWRTENREMPAPERTEETLGCEWRTENEEKSVPDREGEASGCKPLKGGRLRLLSTEDEWIDWCDKKDSYNDSSDDSDRNDDSNSNRSDDGNRRNRSNDRDGNSKNGGSGNEQECFCISDLSKFSKMVSAGNEKLFQVQQKITEKLQKQDAEGFTPFIAICNTGGEMEAAGTPLFEMLLTHQYGIHLGGNAGNQRMLSFEDLSYTQLNQWEKPGIGYLKKGQGSRTRKVRIPLE